MISNFEVYATERKNSMFGEGLKRHRAQIEESLRGASICVVGAAGSIGRSVLNCILEYRPKRVVMVDLSENNLVELTRDLRSASLDLPAEFQTLPIDFGSESFRLFLKSEKPFDYIFNLSAMKHVRSEKDEYCLKRLIETNVLNVEKAFDIVDRQTLKGFFSVSSDKAVNPANAMGATKKIMEDVMLLQGRDVKVNFSRFANVAFSYGSLPYGFIHRIEKKQPLAGPSNIRRYFISHQEAGELCVANAVLGATGQAFFPSPEEGLPEVSFLTIAERVLNHFGYSALLVETEDEAKAAMGSVAASKQWPCIFSASETDGEKDLEEFVGIGEEQEASPVENMGVVQRQLSSDAAEQLTHALDWFRDAQKRLVGKQKYLEVFGDLVPGFSHVSSGKSLDSKM